MSLKVNLDIILNNICVCVCTQMTSLALEPHQPSVEQSKSASDLFQCNTVGGFGEKKIHISDKHASNTAHCKIYLYHNSFPLKLSLGKNCDQFKYSVQQNFLRSIVLTFF